MSPKNGTPPIDNGGSATEATLIDPTDADANMINGAEVTLAGEKPGEKLNNKQEVVTKVRDRSERKAEYDKPIPNMAPIPPTQMAARAR